MDDEVRRLERLAAQDPAHRAALQLALRHAGLPARDVPGILEEAARLSGDLAAARDAWLDELARCWPPLLDALLREEPALDVLVVTAALQEHSDRPWAFLVHVAVDGATVLELVDQGEVLPGERAHEADSAWRFNLLDEDARRHVVEAVLVFAPVFAAEPWRRAARVIVRRGLDDGRASLAVRELERWADGVIASSIQAAVDEADTLEPELRELALAEVGAREVPLRELHDERQVAAAPAASVAELVERARAATATLQAARATALGALGDAFDRLVPALFEQHADLPGFAVHGFTPTFEDGDLCEHVQHVVTDRHGLVALAGDLHQRGLDDLGLGALAERDDLRSRDGVALRYVRLRDAVEPFQDVLEARHGDRPWVLVLERREDGGVDARVGAGHRPY